MLIPLKLKYRQFRSFFSGRPNPGSPGNGRGMRPGQEIKHSKTTKSIRPPRRAYFGSALPSTKLAPWKGLL